MENRAYKRWQVTHTATANRPTGTKNTDEHTHTHARARLLRVKGVGFEEGGVVLAGLL